VIAEDSQQVVPKKRGAIKNRGAAPKMPKLGGEDHSVKKFEEGEKSVVAAAGENKTSEEFMASETVNMKAGAGDDPAPAGDV
jgi:hypothetical protein